MPDAAHHLAAMRRSPRVRPDQHLPTVGDGAASRNGHNSSGGKRQSGIVSFRRFLR